MLRRRDKSRKSDRSTIDAGLEDLTEYVSQIECDSLACDQDLLRDAKGLIQRQSKSSRHQQFADHSVPASSSIPNATPGFMRTVYETEMRSGDTMLEEQGAEEVAEHAQVWDDDNLLFEQALQQAARNVHPETTAEDNLYLLEDQAYRDALETPATIPYLLHPTVGLPTRGVRANEAKKEPLLRRHTPTPLEKNRPRRPPLPDYLQAAEDGINRLLSKTPLSDAEFDRLETLLSTYEPAHVRELRRR
jgi:hypothetical protein